MQYPEEAMPWVGLYVVIASLICTLAMAADVVHGFWKWKFWFPNKFFTLNAATITFIAIAMKLPVDLTTDKSVFVGESNTEFTKIVSIIFLITMLANFLPSLGLMDDKELLANIVALGVLVITILVNVSIQTFTLVRLTPIEVLIPVIMFPILWLFSVALTVSTSRQILEHQYKESQQLVSNHQEKRFSSKDLGHYIKKFWMMTETRNPQFVIACSPVSCAFGVLCALLTIGAVQDVIYRKESWHGTPVYGWSLKIIYIVQSIGIVVGSIAPVFRCFTSIGHYNLSKKWSTNNLNVFRVEKHWIQRIQQWKRSHVRSRIPGRHCQIVFHYIKSTLLNFEMIADESSEIEEYASYVVQIEEDEKLSKIILRNTLHSITQLLDGFEKKEPKSLIKLLEKSTGFIGVVEFENEEVPPLHPEETRNCWSLVVVTLTAIAISLPNISNSYFKGLLSGMREGLQIVRHIEECINVDGDSVKARKATIRGWTEVEVYRTWLQINIQEKANKGKSAKEILQWLGDEAAKVVIQFNSRKTPSVYHSPYKFILASSMYRISQTILLHYNKQEKSLRVEELFEWISSVIGDVLLACFTNLPHVIKMKCHHHAIEKRGDNIRNAAQLLVKSKKILKILKARQLPNIDQDSMAYIDKWRVQLKNQIPSDGHTTNGGSSSPRIQRGFSCLNESVTITIL